MPKANLTLYIDSELKDLAVANHINLSQEFEEWLRIRMNQTLQQPENLNIDIEKEKAKVLLMQKKIAEYEQKQVDEQSKEQKLQQELDGYIDNITKYNNSNTFTELDVHGVQFLMKKKFGQVITKEQAKELLEKRLKERGFIG